VILLDNIIQVFALTQPAAPADDTFLFQALDRRRTGTVFLDVDHQLAPFAPVLCERNV